MTGTEESEVDDHLADLLRGELVQFRENRGLWQLTPVGREAHVEWLAADLDGFDAAEALSAHYPGFVEINVAFKELCGAWQLRDGAPNDHSDPDYDREVIDRLADMHVDAHPVVSAMGEQLDRLGRYAMRLESTLELVRSGDINKFTGVMCGSYHDVWMELHEDLILTQGIDRAAEGSF